MSEVSELARVKAEVKAWEKAFKARNKRDPTKEDIKADSGSIAEQYALYRKLVKAGAAAASSSSSSSQTKQSQGQRPARPPPSSGSSDPIYRSSNASQGPRLTTPRHVPASDYPTTPTPPARRPVSAAGSRRQANPESNPFLDGEPSRGDAGPSTTAMSLKRKSGASVTGQTPRSPIFSTPKKPIYSGPVIDPNPVNPFAMSPLRRSAGKSAGTRSSLPPTPTMDVTSPFIHVSSPRKLKELLQANSLQKRREREEAAGGGGVMGGTNGLLAPSPLRARAVEITPRTRARKRLMGEVVDDTPGKERPQRRRRGEARALSGGAAGPSTQPSGSQPALRGATSPYLENTDNEDDDGEDEDAFGPSPVRPPAGRTFTALLQDAAGESVAEVPSPSKPRSKSGEASNGSANQRMFPIFGRTASTAKLAAQEKPKDAVQPPRDKSRAVANGPTARSSAGVTERQVSGPDLDLPVEDSEMLPPDSPVVNDEDATGRSTSQATPSKAGGARPIKTLTIEQDEEDEWDPESGPVRTQVTIVPTRRAVRSRRDSDLESADDDSAEEDFGDNHDANGDIASATSADVPPLSHKGTTHSSAVPSSPPNAPPLLHLLSIHSPSRARTARAQARADEMRVKAIFDPAQAAKLRALRKGQDVYLPGQGGTSGPAGPGAGGNAAADEDDEDELLERYAATVSSTRTPGAAGQDGDSPEAIEDLGGDAYADDDWDSENEGWKRMGLGMDDVDETAW